MNPFKTVKKMGQNEQQVLYLLPLLLIVLYSIFYYLGIIRNFQVEFTLAFFIVLYYVILNPVVGLVAVFIFIGWTIFRIKFCKTDYSIKKLNEDAMKTTVANPIPKIIIQTGKTKNPPKYSAFIEGVKTKNPKYQYLFFDDDDIETFLKEHYPEYWTTYERLPLLIQKIDFFRYIAVYHYGGIYLDLDMKVLKPFDDALLNHETVFPVDEYLTKPLHRWKRYRPFCKNDCYFLLGQYAFAANTKNAFIKNLIDNIHYRIDIIIQKHTEVLKAAQMRPSAKKQELELYVYQTTGPDYVTQCFMDYYNKNTVFILDNGTRQMFGNYAKHMYMGSWK